MTKLCLSLQKKVFERYLKCFTLHLKKKKKKMRILSSMLVKAHYQYFEPQEVLLLFVIINAFYAYQNVFIFNLIVQRRKKKNSISEFFHVLCIVRSIPKGKEPKPTQKSNAPLLLIEQKASSSDKQDVSDTPFCVCVGRRGGSGQWLEPLIT